MRRGRIFLVAAEDSGDALGAELIQELRRLKPDLEFAGVGGAKMAAEGVKSAIDTSGLQTLGFLDGIRALPLAKLIATQVAAQGQDFRPDLIVLIDSWGFCLRVAMAIKNAGTPGKIIKYIGPQVWAARPGRAKQLAAWVDHLLCIFPFETPFYAPFGLTCTVVGYPPLARAGRGDRGAFRARHGLNEDQELLLVLFGSRPKEILRVAPAFEASLAKIKAQRPNVKFVTFLAPNVAPALRERAKTWPFECLVIEDEQEKFDVYAGADLALCCSGTVTTEVALQGTPVIAAYVTDWLTWIAARAGILRTRYVTLFNVAANAEIAPEYIQTRCRPGLLAPACLRLLLDPQARQAQIAAQFSALERMGRDLPPPNVTAAKVVLELLGQT